MDKILRRAWQPIPVFLPGESPWTEEPGQLQSMGLQRVGHDWVTKAYHSHVDFDFTYSLPTDKIWPRSCGLAAFTTLMCVVNVKIEVDFLSSFHWKLTQQ